MLFYCVNKCSETKKFKLCREAQSGTALSSAGKNSRHIKESQSPTAKPACLKSDTFKLPAKFTVKRLLNPSN
jgi:hypothetical protein